MSLIKLQAHAAMQHEREVSQDADVRQLLSMTPKQINVRVDAMMLSPDGIARMFKIVLRLLIMIARKNIK